MRKAFLLSIISIFCALQAFAQTQDGADHARNDNYVIHIVKWYEDLNVIAEKYGVTVEAIQEANGLTGRKLKSRQQLRIPTNAAPRVKIEHSRAANHPEISQEDSTANATEEKVVLIRPKNKIDVCLLFPFAAQTATPNSNSMEFYCGALLAARDLGKEGTNINLNTFDTYGNIMPTMDIRLGMSDFIIGPIDGKSLSDLLENENLKNTVISPLDTRTDTLALRHNNFIQAPVSAEYQYEDIVNWLESDIRSTQGQMQQDSVILIYEKNIKGESKKNELTAKLSAQGVKYSTFTYTILEGRDILDVLSGKMNQTGNNRVLLASEDEAFANDVIRNLNLLIHNKYTVTLYGVSKIRSFDTIDVNNLHDTNFHCSLSYYIDYDNPKVQQFIMQFRALYNTEPSLMAFQGYDIMYYFSSMRAKYGEGWAEMMCQEKTQMLMSDFHFEQKGEGLVKNTVRRVIYGPDYSVTLLR